MGDEFHSSGNKKIANLSGGGQAEAHDRPNKLILLEKVKDIWVEGALKESVHNAALIELGVEAPVDAVEHSWDMVLLTPDWENRPLPPGKKIVDIFDQMGRALLILGEPGSGKTVTLLELARDAIARAEGDPAQAIPAVFNLSSWAKRRQNLADWLVEEINAKYQIPRTIGRSWVEGHDLLVLLDGLDEVDRVHQAACAEAINQFSQEYGLTDIAVCSRVAEYHALDTRLKLRGAILLQPLTTQQINDYFAAAGRKLEVLHGVLQHDAVLQELAQSPLMLAVMGLAYQDIPAEALSTGQLNSTEARRRHLFAVYVEQMFKHRRAAPDDTPRQTVNRLSWLAQKMTQHNQSVFLIEELQPSWLSTRVQRWLYVMGSRLIGGLAIGVSVTPIFWVLTVLGAEGGAVLLPGFLFLPSFLLLPGLLGAGITVGLTEGLRSKWRRQDTPAGTPRKAGFWRSTMNVLVVGLSAALGCGLASLATLMAIQLAFSEASFVSPGGQYLLGLVVLLVFLVARSTIYVGFPFGLLLGLRRRWQSVRKDIKPVESLTWSWRAFLIFVTIGAILGGMTFVITSARRDSAAKLWDGNGNLLTVLEGHTGQVSSASFSPDGIRIVTAGCDDIDDFGFCDAGTARLWDGDGNLLTMLEGHTEWVKLASFSPDGTQIVTVSRDGKARLWDASNGSLLTALEGHTWGVSSASFSPNGTRITTAGCDEMEIPVGCIAGTARLWDASNGNLLAALEGHTGQVSSASFSPDGARIVTAGCDDIDRGGLCVAGTARLWDGDGNLLTTLEGHTGQVSSASFSPDGTRIVTASRDGTARIWDASNGNLLNTLEGHTGEVDSASFSPDGTRIVTVSRYDTAARLWYASNGNLLTTLEGHTEWLNSASFSPDGTRIATASRDGTARLWDVSNGNFLIALQGHTHALNSASFSPDGTRILTTSTAADERPLSVVWPGLGLLLGLLGGLRTGVRETKTSPNQGIRLSARNAVVIGLIGGLIVAVMVGLTFVIMYASTPQPTDRFSDLATLLSISSLWLGIAVACWYGGLDVIQHFVLRLILYSKGHIPWNYARFLDCAAERIFLRKVGGGYIFIHRLLLEYFAGLNWSSSREE